MLVRKCDMCKEEITGPNDSYWEVKIHYITMGESNSKTGTYVDLQLCDKCYKKLKLQEYERKV